MQPSLVRAGKRWSMEAAGIAMGEMEIIRMDTGEKKIYRIDGKIEKKKFRINWCDKCEKWQDYDFGRYDGAQGLDMIWLCVECK